MNRTEWLVIGKNGIRSVRKSKPVLSCDEISIKINLQIPDELFMRPTLEAKIKVDNIASNSCLPEIIVNTAELIEQQTGAKIEFSVVEDKEKEQNK